MRQVQAQRLGQKASGGYVGGQRQQKGRVAIKFDSFIILCISEILREEKMWQKYIVYSFFLCLLYFNISLVLLVPRQGSSSQVVGVMQPS